MVKDSRVILLHSDERQGRGRALNRALTASNGSIFCYYDVDLATDLKHLPELLTRIERGAAVATGSRLMKDSNIRRSGDRDQWQHQRLAKDRRAAAAAERYPAAHQGRAAAGTMYTGN